MRRRNWRRRSRCRIRGRRRRPRGHILLQGIRMNVHLGRRAKCGDHGPHLALLERPHVIIVGLERIRLHVEFFAHFIASNHRHDAQPVSVFVASDPQFALLHLLAKLVRHHVLDAKARALGQPVLGRLADRQPRLPEVRRGRGRRRGRRRRRRRKRREEKRRENP